nr:MAG TPA: hypothetical protein [Bacteriophage sp.]
MTKSDSVYIMVAREFRGGDSFVSRVKILMSSLKW